MNPPDQHPFEWSQRTQKLTNHSDRWKSMTKLTNFSFIQLQFQTNSLWIICPWKILSNPEQPQVPAFGKMENSGLLFHGGSVSIKANDKLPAWRALTFSRRLSLGRCCIFLERQVRQVFQVMSRSLERSLLPVCCVCIMPRAIERDFVDVDTTGSHGNMIMPSNTQMCVQTIDAVSLSSSAASVKATGTLGHFNLIQIQIERQTFDFQWKLSMNCSAPIGCTWRRVIGATVGNYAHIKRLEWMRNVNYGQNAPRVSAYQWGLLIFEYFPKRAQIISIFSIRTNRHVGNSVRKWRRLARLILRPRYTLERIRFQGQQTADFINFENVWLNEWNSS